MVDRIRLCFPAAIFLGKIISNDLKHFFPQVFQLLTDLKQQRKESGKNKQSSGQQNLNTIMYEVSSTVKFLCKLAQAGLIHIIWSFCIKVTCNIIFFCQFSLSVVSLFMLQDNCTINSEPCSWFCVQILLSVKFINSGVVGMTIAGIFPGSVPVAF